MALHTRNRRRNATTVGAGQSIGFAIVPPTGGWPVGLALARVSVTIQRPGDAIGNVRGATALGAPVAISAAVGVSPLERVARALIDLAAASGDVWPDAAAIADIALDVIAGRRRTLVDRVRRWRWGHKRGRLRIADLSIAADELVDQLGQRKGNESVDSGAVQPVKGNRRATRATEGQPKGNESVGSGAVQPVKGNRRATEGQTAPETARVCISLSLLKNYTREEKHTLETAVGAIYDEYPNRHYPKRAYNAIARVLIGGVDPADLLRRTIAFADRVRIERKPTRYVPYPEKWYNDGGYLTVDTSHNGGSNGTGPTKQPGNGDGNRTTDEIRRSAELLSGL